MRKNKLVSVLLSSVVILGALTGCGSSSSEDKVINVGASPTPHAQILDHVKDELKEEGYTLKVTEFTGYVQPNNVVEDGDLDANFFQHTPYLDSFNKENKTHLVSVAKIHYEPFGIYAGTKNDLSKIAKGDEVAIPNDTTNEARALLLLEDQGLIKLKEGAGINATTKDIVSNPKGIKLQELEAASISKYKQDAAYLVLNGNYALDAGYVVSKDALATEKSTSEAASTYANIVAVKKGNENNEKVKALVKALQSDSTKKWINDKYKGSVVAYDGK